MHNIRNIEIKIKYENPLPQQLNSILSVFYFKVSHYVKRLQLLCWSLLVMLLVYAMLKKGAHKQISFKSDCAYDDH